MRKILDQVKPDRQTLLFSATLDGDIGILVKHYQNDPVECEIEADDSHWDRITHEFLRVQHADRVTKAAEIVEQHGATVVFCRTKRGVDRVCDQLKKRGISAVPIHGGRSQGQRDRALAAFTKQKAQALVATDVAARGIHVNDVQCVLHYDIAGDHKDYVHRSGRTGRAGADGIVVSFVTDADVGKARHLRRSLSLPGDHPDHGDEAGSDRRGHGHGKSSGRRRPPRRSRHAGRGTGEGRAQGSGQGQRKAKGSGETGSGKSRHDVARKQAGTAQGTRSSDDGRGSSSDYRDGGDRPRGGQSGGGRSGGKSGSGGGGRPRNGSRPGQRRHKSRGPKGGNPRAGSGSGNSR